LILPKGSYYGITAIINAFSAHILAHIYLVGITQI